MIAQLRNREQSGAAYAPFFSAASAQSAASRARAPRDAECLAPRALLAGHAGCVNTATWTRDGRHALTGSDDTRICVFSPWGRGPRAPALHRVRPLLTLASGHANNIFCVRSLSPALGGALVSCAADGQVRLHTLNMAAPAAAGAVTHVLSRHGSRAHRLAVPGGAGPTFASCGEDGAVRFYDVRAGQGTRCETSSFTVQTRRGARLRLFSLDYRPGSASQLCTGGSDGVARIFDARFLHRAPYQFLPRQLRGEGQRSALAQGVSLTCAAFSRDGARLAVALNDEATYVLDVDGGDAEVPWDAAGEGNSAVRVLAGAGAAAQRVPVEAAAPAEAAAERRRAAAARPRTVPCSDHINMQTIKGVSFWGARDEFVLQGSDDGRVYVYCSRSGDAAHCFLADATGAVNVLSPHPDPECPALLTAGLDDTVKLWAPRMAGEGGEGSGGESESGDGSEGGDESAEDLTDGDDESEEGVEEDEEDDDAEEEEEEEEES